MSKKIAIGGDHAGYEYKSALIDSLKEWGYQPVNFGADTADSVDYPDFAHPVASAVENKEADFGVLICGSANGVAITANKHAGIRAAICWEKEIASLARLHNNANVVCIPARFIELGLAKEIVKEFLETDFEGGRHARRVDKISCI